MTLMSRLAHVAKRAWRAPANQRAETDIANTRRRARTQLKSRVSAHILKDVGVDDS